MRIPQHPGFDPDREKGHRRTLRRTQIFPDLAFRAVGAVFDIRMIEADAELARLRLAGKDIGDDEARHILAAATEHLASG